MNEARAARRQDGRSPALQPLFLFLSRLSLALSALLLALMPWTEQFGSWDRFLRGGDDLELGLLATIALLALVLLLADHRRGTLTELAALTHWLALLFPLPATLASAGQGRATTNPTHARLSGMSGSACPLPLRI